MWVFGLGIGFLVVLIRAFGVWADAVPFAVILMNILTPLLDRIPTGRPREAAVS
jgi:electron transport complex protein RnfD